MMLEAKHRLDTTFSTIVDQRADKTHILQNMRLNGKLCNRHQHTYVGEDALREGAIEPDRNTACARRLTAAWARLRDHFGGHAVWFLH